jgi:redox-sensitive bicupin YhaK (pirin superfamily)
VDATLILGSLDGAASPGRVFSPLMGADLSLADGADARLPVHPDFEYAALAMSGAAVVDGVRVEPGSMLYLGCGRRELPLRADDGPASVMLLGGEPFEEKLVMWWNFVARTHEDIAAAREEWMHGSQFGVVHGFDGAPIPAPELPALRLKPRGRER